MSKFKAETSFQFKEVNDIQSLQQRFCTQNKTKQNKSIPVRVVILYHTPLVFKPLCLQLTIDNIWTKHWSVWSHMAIKTKKKNFFQAMRFKVAPWLETLSMKVVSSYATSIQKKLNTSKLSFFLWPLFSPMSLFANVSGQTNWCLTWSKCLAIIVDHSKSRKYRLKNFTRKKFKAKKKKRQSLKPL